MSSLSRKTTLSDFRLETLEAKKRKVADKAKDAKDPLKTNLECDAVMLKQMIKLQKQVIESSVAK